MRVICLDLDKAMSCEEVQYKQIKTIACPPACLGWVYFTWVGGMSAGLYTL